MSYHLTPEKKLKMLDLNAEGLGLRAVARIVGCSKCTSMAFFRRVADYCRDLSSEYLCDMNLPHIQVDEIWTFVGKKKADGNNPDLGRKWIFIGIDPKSRLIPFYHIGDRNEQGARDFLNYARTLLKGECSITTDYLEAYVQAIKYADPVTGWINRSDKTFQHTRIFGYKHGDSRTGAHTNNVEAHNRVLRQSVSRMRRSSVGFAKTMRDLRDSLDIYFCYYNFIKAHSKTGKCPVVSAGLMKKPYSWKEILSFAGENGFGEKKTALPCSIAA